ncbi:MAG TPA: cytochrome c oxidase subunit II [Tepidisphaeraceae bacterium]|jgi:cytochrome c oxidase subunit 2
MSNAFRIFPEQASRNAWNVDALFLFEFLVSCFFVFLIAGLVLYFSLKYRRRSDDDVPAYTPTSTLLELTYIFIPASLMVIMFFWGGWIYIRNKRPPANAMQINVVGKQWMWKLQHPEGPREINTLHVPVGRPIKLVLTSQDVIHDFGIPDFRIKQDVIPGIYVTEWFEATRTGEFHLFCNQYCGDLHSRMIGSVIVMQPAAYQSWLEGRTADEPAAVSGSRLFQSYGCATCHGQRAPSLAGLYMSLVKLNDGTTTIADEQYLRESIVAPANKLVAGFGPIMPTYQGQLSEEQIFDLIEYIKSLGAAMDNTIPGASAAGPQTRPSTQPVNGYHPDLLLNQPPAREPPGSNQSPLQQDRRP